MKKALCLFAMALVLITRIETHDSKDSDKKDLRFKDYSEFTLWWGSLVSGSSMPEGGVSLGIQFVQSHYLAERFGFIDLLTGLEFQLSNLYNESTRIRPFKLGVVVSFRLPFYSHRTPIPIFWPFKQSGWCFLEFFLDIKPGIAYAVIDIDLASVESKGNGFLAYTTFQAGITFGNIGEKKGAGGFSLFYSWGNIFSRSRREEDIIFFQGFNIALAFRF